MAIMVLLCILEEKRYALNMRLVLRRDALIMEETIKHRTKEVTQRQKSSENVPKKCIGSDHDSL